MIQNVVLEKHVILEQMLQKSQTDYFCVDWFIITFECSGA